ncbi:MAG: hypothetical protein QGH88_00320 [Nitrosopumilus sp.]|jgi:hypothetical protein|nr:hypothetical protein [Nitrosopumilus sp.]HJM25802.1 hypothetical protein [Nitrosopumilus sp.]|tara:strand:- start:39035 stop:39226 length:192 start_codon:yes stop_codon:yes gene_type:complete
MKPCLIDLKWVKNQKKITFYNRSQYDKFNLAMLGINREIQKIAIQSQLMGYKALLKITNTVSK